MDQAGSLWRQAHCSIPHRVQSLYPSSGPLLNPSPLSLLPRFAPLQLPDSFYEDFAHVADDESRHLG